MVYDIPCRVAVERSVFVCDRNGWTIAECRSGYRTHEQDADVARRIAACLNACRDISTEDLELCGENAFNRNWNLRQFAQYAMFNGGDSAKGE